MTRHLLIRYHEVALKGKNRSAFVGALAANARKALARAGLSYPVRQEYSQIRVDLPEEGDAAPALRVLSRVYGIARIAPALKTGLSVDEITGGVRELIATEWNGARSFRVSASRSDKRYPLTSMDLNRADRDARGGGDGRGGGPARGGD